MSSLIDLILLNESMNETIFYSLKKNLKSKIIPLIFYSCEEDNYSCCFFIWESILKCTNNLNKIDANFWFLMNTKKAFIPKFLNLMRCYANRNANIQNIEIIFSNLTPLISKLTTVFDSNERIQFYKEVFAKLNDVFINYTESTNRNRATKSNRIIIRQTIFDLAGFVISELNIYEENDYFDFIQYILSNNVCTFFILFHTKEKFYILKCFFFC
jgi:hypothetical protein